MFKKQYFHAWVEDQIWKFMMFQETPVTFKNINSMKVLRTWRIQLNYKFRSKLDIYDFHGNKNIQSPFHCFISQIVTILISSKYRNFYTLNSTVKHHKIHRFWINKKNLSLSRCFYKYEFFWLNICL